MKILKFSEQELINLGIQKHEVYKSNPPFPNISFDDFFEPESLREVLAEFPELGKEKGDIFYTNPNEVKYASNGVYRFGPKTRDLVSYLNSQPFLEFLQNLTGIKDSLIPDPYFQGGGFHQIKPGGFLKLHVDFHKHKMMNLDRRINVLIYLNENWEEEYGGHFELWEKDKSKCIVRIPPIFNKMAIFSTTDFSWHGHPDPLTCPQGRSRKSLALYYYTHGRPEYEISEINRKRITTTFTARQGQDSKKMIVFNNLVNLANDWLPPAVVRAIKGKRNK
ncbi:MAG: 2OG-Fe(II) oxygenase [Saprospiraceae bacterium]